MIECLYEDVKKIVALLLALAILIQTAVYIKAGIDKSYIHMDETYSLGLASYDKVEIQDNEDFYDTWHNGEYYEDYLALNDDEITSAFLDATTLDSVTYLKRMNACDIYYLK